MMVSFLTRCALCCDEWSNIIHIVLYNICLLDWNFALAFVIPIGCGWGWSLSANANALSVCCPQSAVLINLFQPQIGPVVNNRTLKVDSLVHVNPFYLILF